MFKRVKPERVAGIVALTYLVLIPAGAFVAYRKIQIIDQDVTAMWDKMDPSMRPDHEAPPLVNLPGLKRFFGVG